VLWFDSSFLFPFYDTAWDGVCVTTNGALVFDRASTLGNNTALPSRSRIDAIYPFWDDLVVDDEGGIYLGTTEVDGLAAQVIEWRNATFYGDRTARVSFSVTLIADGRIQIGYGDGVGGENPLTHGSSATVGVESLTGNPASQYSFDQSVLTDGAGLEYTLPQSGTIEGKVTDRNDGKAIAGAVVTLTAPDGSTRTITTDEEGRWKAQALVGASSVDVWAPNYVASHHRVTIAEKDQAEVVDTALATGIATVSGGDLDWFLGPDQKATADLTVTNTGSAPLHVVASEQQRTDQGEHVAGDLPWLSLAGAASEGTVELAVGESTTITATVDNADVDPGVLLGDVLVATDAGRPTDQYHRARMATSAYWLGVDAGGRGATGTDGFAWSADQALGAGAWGYVGGSASTTKADIAGTDDDDLFRTERSGKTFSYVFRNAPAGTYRIGLDFAEIENVKAGMRPFDVLVDGKAVLYDHDVQAEKGALTADVHGVTVEHAGGDLQVVLVGQTGRRNPILSALKIQEDPRL
jgi:hypothetical protein